MNRDLYHPLTVGAVIIWIIMALSLYISLKILLPVSALSFTIFRYYQNKLTQNIFIIVISCIIGSVGLLRVDLENNVEYIPFVDKTSLKGDITIIGDSVPVGRGYMSKGQLTCLTSIQFTSISLNSIVIFSCDELLRGTMINNVVVRNRAGQLSAVVTNRTIMEYSSSFYRIRAKILLLIKGRLPSSLLIALITGNRAGLKIEEIEAFRTSGCSHILALSGFHVGIITMLIILLLRIFFTGGKIYIIAGIVLSIYLSFVGVTPSLLRSVLMFIIGTIFKLKNWKISVFRILVISYFIVLITLPGEFYTLSFKLSYLALAGILTIGSEISSLLAIVSIPIILRLPVAASISAMVTTSFICFPLFGILYPVGIAASVAITPVITIFMWMGLLSILFPNISIIVLFMEKIIYDLMNFFSKFPVIDNSLLISPVVTLIISLIPVILLIIKLYRRVDAGRFNLKFKL